MRFHAVSRNVDILIWHILSCEVRTRRVFWGRRDVPIAMYIGPTLKLATKIVG